MDFVKNENLLEEDYRVEDLLDFSAVISDFKDTLQKISANAVVGLVGGFGSGKSTMLYQLYRNLNEKDQEKWINFDAWKYPERKDLWEGFILDFARQIDGDTFQKTRKRIDGTHRDDAKTLLNTIGDIPGLSVIKNFSHFFETSPAKRVFEIQEILKELIDKVGKEIYIVVEDIDRSGDNGVFFLETLRNFIKENSFNKKIVVIVPIGTETLNDKVEASYSKCLDYRFDFKPSNIDFTKFIKAVFDEKFLNEEVYIQQINYLFQSALRQIEKMTIREIKRIIRAAIIDGKRIPDGSIFDLRVFLVFVFMRYAKIGKSGWVMTDNMKSITHTDFGYNALIWIANTKDITNLRNLDSYLQVQIRILLNSQNNNAVPVFNQFTVREQKNYILTDKYLGYLHIA